MNLHPRRGVLALAFLGSLALHAPANPPAHNEHAPAPSRAPAPGAGAARST